MKHYYTLEETLYSTDDTLEPQRARLVKGEGVYELTNTEGMPVYFDRKDVVKSEHFKKHQLETKGAETVRLGEEYFYLGDEMGRLIVKEGINRNPFITFRSILSGNLFKTREEAEEALSRIRG